MASDEGNRPQEEQESEGNRELGQDPFVERLRPDPSEPPQHSTVLEGLLGDSDREGYKRLYFSRELDSYAEFREEDVLHRERIPREELPMAGLEASRVTLRGEATVEYTRTSTPRPVDEFDLDVRISSIVRRAPGFFDTFDVELCPGRTRGDCPTRFPANCGGPTREPADPLCDTIIKFGCRPTDTCRFNCP